MESLKRQVKDCESILQIRNREKGILEESGPLRISLLLEGNEALPPISTDDFQTKVIGLSKELFGNGFSSNWFTKDVDLWWIVIWDC